MCTLTYLDDKCAACLSIDLLQVDCQNLFTGLRKLFQQVVTSLQMTSCHKRDFNICCNFMKLTSLSQLVHKLQKAGKVDNNQLLYGFRVWMA